jgi:hypothetical protein
VLINPIQTPSRVTNTRDNKRGNKFLKDLCEDNYEGIKMKLYSMVEKYKYKEEIGMLISVDSSLVWNKKRLATPVHHSIQQAAGA